MALWPRVVLSVSTNGEVRPWAGSVSHQLSGSRDQERDQARQVRREGRGEFVFMNIPTLFNNKPSQSAAPSHLDCER